MSFLNRANMEYFKAEHVSFFYDVAEEGGQVQQMLCDASMRIRRGEFVVLSGHNDPGRSIMVKHFNIVLLSSGGWVCVDGMDTMNENLKYEIRQRVGLVLQNPDNRLVANIVEEGMVFGSENLGIPPAEIHQRVDATLEAMGVSEYASRSAHKLFGGQKQRVVIAGIIAMQPDCIVLDELTAIPGPRDHAEVMKAVHWLNRERGVTVVLITHYMDKAMQADRVIVMNNGETLLEGAPREVFSHVELLRQHSLDILQIMGLLYRLGKIDYTMPEGILSEEECVATLELLLNE